MTTFASLLNHRRSPWRATQALLVLLLASAVLLGGTPNEPNWRMALVCIVACALAAWSLAHGAAAAFQRLPLLSRVAVLAFPALWLLQLVPLPPAIWEGLEGRELARRVLDLVGARGDWHPLSLTPADTLFGAAMFLPCLAAFLAGLTLDQRGRERCVASFLMLAALSIFVGLAQLSSRGTVFNFHDSGHKANLLGFFANRNHEALMLGVAGVFAIDTLRRDVRATAVALGLSLAVMLVVLVCVVGTTSRAGLALAALGMLAMAAVAFGKTLSVRRLCMGAGAVAVLALLFSLSPVVERSTARFGDVAGDARWQAWSRSVPLVSQYFPWGGGLGGFTRHYNPIEPLDSVRHQYLNHAHNDYLEVLIEAGLPGMMALLLVALALCARSVRLGRREAPARFGFTVPAAIGIGLVALHSLVDYPLRTQALAVTFGLLAAFFLGDPARPEPVGEVTGQRPKTLRAALLFVFLATGTAMGFRAVTWHQSLAYPPELPLLAVPDVPVSEGLKEELAKHLATEPLDVAALNLLYASEVREGVPPARRAELAAVLGDFGWRNSAAQQNLMLEAARNGEVEAALLRADGLLRRNILAETLLPAMRRMETDETAAAVLAERLLLKPGWRGAYLGDASHLGDPAARAARRRLIERMIARGDCPSPAEFRPTLDAFQRAGDPERAIAVSACERRPNDVTS